MKRLWFAAIPLALGALIAAVSLATGDRRLLALAVPLPTLWLILGAAVAAIMAAGLAVRAARDAGARRGRGEAEIEAADTRRRFVDRLDHELKNPVMAIRAGLSNITGDPDAVTAITAQAERLSRVLGELRTLGDLESVAIEVAPVDLADVLADVRDAIAEVPGANERVLTITLPRAPRPLPAVPGDVDLLFLALYNVIANAVKYTGPGDRIEVRGTEDDHGVTIDVADTGPGIPADEQDLVWEELARGSRTRHVAGSGLGLPLVRAIVLRHGGTATLRSREREGTVVTVHLPFAAGRG